MSLVYFKTFTKLELPNRSTISFKVLSSHETNKGFLKTKKKWCKIVHSTDISLKPVKVSSVEQRKNERTNERAGRLTNQRQRYVALLFGHAKFIPQTYHATHNDKQHTSTKSSWWVSIILKAFCNRSSPMPRIHSLPKRTLKNDWEFSLQCDGSKEM